METQTARAAGYFVVNGTGDLNISDAGLTLREALLVARGGTGAGGLGGAASPQEQALLGGCVFDGGGLITGGCGPAFPDTITFASSLGSQPVITLLSALPVVDDSAATAIDGRVNNVYPIVNAADIGAGNDGLVITSNLNAVWGLAVVSSPRDGLRVTGNGNYLGGTSSAQGAGRHGVHFDGGDDNLIENALIGVFSVTGTTCGAANAQSGIGVTNGASTNTIQDSIIGCNGSAGVGVIGSGTQGNTIGPGNRIGTNLAATANLGNPTGVLISLGAQLNSVVTNTLAYNTEIGVHIAGGDTRFNAVRGNTIQLQGSAGVQIDGGARDNLVGSPANLIAYNAFSGIFLAGGAHHNAVNDNGIFRNNIYGVLLDGVGTANNVVSETAIYNNGADGIGERNNAGSNVWAQVSLTGNGGLGIDRDASHDATNTPTGPYPVITSVARAGSMVTVSGTANTAGLLFSVVDLYQAAPDPSGFGEGQVYLGSDVVDVNGAWSVTALMRGEAGCFSFTALQTDTFSTPLGNASASSEFGLATAFCLYLPLVMR